MGIGEQPASHMERGKRSGRWGAGGIGGRHLPLVFVVFCPLWFADADAAFQASGASGASVGRELELGPSSNASRHYISAPLNLDQFPLATVTQEVGKVDIQTFSYKCLTAHT